MKGERAQPQRDPNGATRWRISPHMLVLLGILGVLAIAANVGWWFRRPTLQPRPSIPMAQLEPPVAGLIAAAMSDLERDERSPMAWGNLGAVLRAHDLGPEANVCFRNAELLDRSDYRWPYYLGVSLNASNADEALGCFRRASQLAGDRPHVHLRLAEALLDCGLPAEASPIVERVLTIKPSDARAQLAKARILFLEGKLEESRQWADKSAAGASDARAPRLLLAQICRRLNDAQGQARALQALKTIPDGITPWPDPDIQSLIDLRLDLSKQLLAVDQLAGSGQLSAAASALADLAQNDDPSASAALKLADALFQQQKFAEAEKVLREQLKGRHDDERIHFQLGNACFQQRRFEQAIAEFRRTIELKPDHVAAQYNLGHALRNSGDPGEAKSAFAAAVRLRPGHAFAHANLAELLLAEGNRKEADQHLEIAAKLIPDDPKVRELTAKLGLAER